MSITSSRKRKVLSYHRHLSTMVINTHGQLLAKENSNEGVLFKLPDNCKVCYIGNLNRSLYFQTNLIERFKDLIYHGKGFLKSDFGQEKIGDLKDKEVEVWNGVDFSKTKVYQTSEESELIEVHTN